MFPELIDYGCVQLGDVHGKSFDPMDYIILGSMSWVCVWKVF